MNIKKLTKMIKTETHTDITDMMTYEKNYNKYDGDKFTVFVPKTLSHTSIVPAIVAHTDTVSQNKPKNLDIDDKWVMTNPDGVLGADDRAGCYIMYEMIKANVNAIFIFTDLEEKGGLGARSCAESAILAELTENISCFIELDRRGGNDCATYGVDNIALISIFGEHKYYEDMGSYTDIVDLCEATNIAGVNLSVGYYNEHTKNESLNLHELDRTLNVMLNLKNIKELYGKVFEIEFNTNLYGGVSEYDYQEEVTPCECDYCGEHKKLWFVDNLTLCEECMKYDW